MNIKFQDISLDVVPDKTHEWLLDTSLVAEGYGVTVRAIDQVAKRKADEIEEGRHFIMEQIVLNGKKRSVRHWTKKGVIALGFLVRSEKAKLFRRWAEDLILKVLERPVESLQGLEQHTKREVQVKNSKDVNRYLFRNWDRETLIDYNRKNCKMVSGYSPSELRKFGKKNGLKSTQYSSGKEVLRTLKPSLAAQMSLNDDLVQKGVKLDEANALSAPCVPLLDKMIHLKMITA